MSTGETDLFLIAASDGVWEHITDDEAVTMVYNIYEKGGARHGHAPRGAYRDRVR